MDGVAWAGSAMIAARARLDIAAGNLANVSTDGFARMVARGKLTSRGAEIYGEPAREHGALRRTGRTDDLAIVGDGAFRLRADDGSTVTTRNGAFLRDRDGHVRDDAGRVLLGARGALDVPEGSTVDEQGRVMLHGRVIDRLPLPAGSSLRSGFLESAGVDAVSEMVLVLTAQRSFESAEKIVSAIDGTRQKAANDVARIK